MAARLRAAHFFKQLDRSLDSRSLLAGARYSIADISALCTIDFAKIVEIVPSPELANVARRQREVSARPSADA